MNARLIGRFCVAEVMKFAAAQPASNDWRLRCNAAEDGRTFMKTTLQKRRMDRAMVKAALTALLLAVSAVPALAQITTLESVNSDGVKGDRGSWYPSISADGRYVAFVSDASNLVPGSAAPCLYFPNPVSCRHVYVRDRLLGITTMISTNDAGEPGNGSS